MIAQATVGSPAGDLRVHGTADRIWSSRRTVLLYLALVVIMFAFLFPLLWALSASLKGKDELFKTDPSLIVRHPTLINYAQMLRQVGSFGTYFKNSTIVSGGTLIVVVVVASLAGYGFARVDFRGREIVFYAMVLAMFVPRSGGLMATYEVMDALHLRNSLIGLILAFSGSMSVPVFIMRQAFLNVPKEMEEAAVLDGASLWQTFWRVSAPMATGAMIVVGIFNFVHTWGEYIFTITMIDTKANYTLGVGIAMLLTAEGDVLPTDVTSYGSRAAAYLMAAFPAMVVFVLFQRWFVRGLMDGLKL